MKIFLLSIICVCCGIVGISIKNYYRKRKNVYEELLNFAKRLKEEIFFKKSFLGETKEIIPHSNSVDAIINGRYDKDCALSEREQRELGEKFLAIGKSSMEYEMTNLDEIILFLSEKTGKASEILKIKGDLSIKLGFLIGVAVFILFI